MVDDRPGDFARDNRVHAHDLDATILRRLGINHRRLGINHTRLTFKFWGAIGG
jgi:hypothetical protein